MERVSKSAQITRKSMKVLFGACCVTISGFFLLYFLVGTITHSEFLYWPFLCISGICLMIGILLIWRRWSRRLLSTILEMIGCLSLLVIVSNNSFRFSLLSLLSVVIIILGIAARIGAKKEKEK